MNHPFALPLSLATAVLLAACSVGGPDDSDSVFRHFSIRDSAVVVHAPALPDALVDASGTLSLEGKAVPTTPAQRALLVRYHADVLTLRRQAIEVGKAGIRTAGKAIGSVVAGLASGSPDSIGPKVEARAEDVRTDVAAMCATLRDVRTTQDAIATQLAPFRPYATLTAAEVDDCR